MERELKNAIKRLLESANGVTKSGYRSQTTVDIERVCLAALAGNRDTGDWWVVKTYGLVKKRLEEPPRSIQLASAPSHPERAAPRRQLRAPESPP